MRYHAQAINQHVLVNSYLHEEEAFLKSFQLFPCNSKQSTANRISSHVLYKVESNDDLLLLPKVLIALHGYKVIQKAEVQSDFFICPLLEIGAVPSTAVIRKRRLVKKEVKSTFL